jgi:hypothetical protein
VRWGSGSAADAWRKRGHEQGGPYRPVDDAQPTATRDRWVRVMCAVRAWPTEQRGRGEADRWAAGIVPGGGLTDRWTPASSGRGREEREGGACVGRPEKEGGGPSRDE